MTALLEEAYANLSYGSKTNRYIRDHDMIIIYMKFDCFNVLLGIALCHPCVSSSKVINNACIV